MEILVLLPVEERHRQKLLAAAAQAHFVWSSLETVTAEQVSQAEVILGSLPLPLLPAATRLRWLQLHFTGADAYLGGVVPESVLLTSATGAFGLALAEHSIAMLLALMKRLPAYGQCQQKQEWADLGPVPSLWGAQVLIVGYGDVGQELATRLAPFGPQLYGIRRHRLACPPLLSAMATLDELDGLLPQMDVVFSALPGVAATRGVFGTVQFARMKRSAYFVNVGRGSAVDSLALVQALEQGRIAGAALDVTDPEPLPAGHPLWNAPNLLLTPHIAGQFHVAETLERIVDICVYNLNAYVQGLPLRSQVDRQAGYRRLVDVE